MFNFGGSESTTEELRHIVEAEVLLVQPHVVTIDVAHSISGERVAAVLDRAGLVRGFPRSIVCDNGLEFTSRVLDQWAHERVIELS